MSDDMEFQPIEGNARDFSRPPADDGVRVLDQDDRSEIESLLLSRTVTAVADEHLRLDDGTVIQAIGNTGCPSCPAGEYDLSILNSVDNVITRVSFDYCPRGWRPSGDDDRSITSEHPDDPADERTGYYRIFVFADNEQINLMQFEGSRVLRHRLRAPGPRSER